MPEAMQRRIAPYVDVQAHDTGAEAEFNRRMESIGDLSRHNDYPVRPGLQALDHFVTAAMRDKMHNEVANRAATLNAMETRPSVPT